ncbi:glucose dehydrogenase [FAD, quinone]-like [Coccinella septempunctata]|uniref:glucose dehydrogenase [FAD, quinone]-like n=1 Tax=Coccinella septempunctata TaxID=41139 RepID=UPI001D0902D1|nr:glucose dehydrogenase [FAD, quinone]-like [Coccinella septempunctata]
MSLEMYLRLYVLFTLFMCFCCEEENLKLNYLEKLLKSSIEKSKSYRVRENNSDFFRSQSDDNKVIDYGTFDFIIVGAGSSGSVVATRLSEIEKWRILLLEAGDMDDDLTDIPYVWQVLQFSERNWGYNTVPQKNGCFGLENNQAPYQRGKVLGGSGTINGLGFIRGNKADYDKWALLGNPGWSYHDLLPYFKRMENFESDKLDPKYRGFAGPLNIAYQVPKDNLSFFESSGQELGLKVLEDYNGADQMGISRRQRTIQYGKRVSGATAYVRPSMNRRNFNLTLNALVTKISIDKSTKTANGVIFVKDGRKYKAGARKEVIISGGAINTPQILMLSGIGPPDELKKHKIETIVNLPVGVKALDHFELRIYFRTNYTIESEPLRKLLQEYLEGKGTLTSLDNGKTFAYINTRNPSSSVPNLEMNSYFNNPVPISIPAITNYKKETEEYVKTIDSSTDLSIDMYILHPKSTGSVKLRSNNPRDFPLVDPGTLNEEDDATVFLEGIRFLDRFEKTETARRVNATKLKITICGDHVEGTDDYWLCVIKSLVVHGGHISSTAKMGPRKDPFAVVNHELKVYGVKGLRVVDCSIMPTTISGHTNSIAFAIGEKASDMIKRSHKL